MKLGAFSVSLAVKDINASLEFYQKLGFEQTGGDIEQKWLILRNGETVVGLFQGMFDKNIFTFNPGWNQQCEMEEAFDDVRQLQEMLYEKGLDTGDKIESNNGPASFTLTDPDGNSILIDQHR